MQYSCRTAPDENGVMRRKCERIVKKFRQCPGAPRECLEETREETDETNATSGGMMPGGSCRVLSACVQRIISFRSGTRSRVTRRAMVACLVLPTCWGSP